MKRLALMPLALVLLLPGFLQAAEFTLTVLEKGTGDPVQDATVVEEGGEFSTTDAAGKAMLELKPPTNIKVLASGYETQTRRLQGANAGTVYLVPLSVEAEGLAVVEDRVPDNNSKVTLITEELRKAPGSRGDPLKVVQSLPGVVSQGNRNFVRGSGAGGNGVWVNRLPLNYLYHWGDVFGGVSTINPDLVKDFNIFLGGFPVEYGERLGGFFDIQLRAPKKDRLHQNYRLAINEAALLLEGPVGATDSFYLAGRHSYLDALFTPARINALTGADKDQRITSIVSVPRYYDAQALWRHELPRGNLDVQFFAAGDALEVLNRSSTKTDPDLAGQLNARVDYKTAGLVWRQGWRPGWDTTMALSINNIREDQSIGADADGQAYFARTDFLRATWQPELVWHRSENAHYTLGAELAYGRFPVDLYIGNEPSDSAVDYNLTTATKYRLNKTIQAASYAPYIKYRRQWGERWTTTLGLRYTAIAGSGGIDMQGWSPRLSLEYALTPATQLIGSWGRYLQMPAESQLLDGFGNPGLTFTEAEHRVVGVLHRFNVAWNLQVEAYHKPMRHLSVPITGAAPPDNYANVGSGEAYGVDVLLKREYSGRRMGWLSYSYGRSRRTNALTGESYRFSADQPQTLTLVWRQPLPGTLRRWDLGVKFQVHSGTPYTPVIGREKWCRDTNGLCNDPNIAETDPLVFWRPVYADFNSARLPTFYMMDLRVDRPIRFDTWKMNFYVDMQNVTAAGNVLGYNYGENYQDYDHPSEATGLPLLIPFIGIEARF